MDWERDGTDWPNRSTSRFVAAADLRWHVQVGGQGPSLLLLHGTGAATHSWRDLMPLLCRRFRVIAPDLPGHGFTSQPSADGSSLPGMSSRIGELLAILGVEPVIAVGHSAGAAIAARMCLDHRIHPRALVSLNGAFLPFAGVGRLFSPVAKLLASTPLVARFAASRARDPQAVARLLGSTGSRLDAGGAALYSQVVQNPGHVAGALAMMANWDLHGLSYDLRRLAAPVLMLVGDNDLTVPPRQSLRVAALLPHAKVETLGGLGHLAHEERPGLVAERVFAFADEHSAAPRVRDQ